MNISHFLSFSFLFFLYSFFHISFQCFSGLPNKELPPSTTVKFPRWNSTKEHFAVIPEVNLTVALSIFGEDLVLCWDGNQTAVKASEGDCQGLPAREVHKVTLDYETQEIKVDTYILPSLVGCEYPRILGLIRVECEGTLLNSISVRVLMAEF